MPSSHLAARAAALDATAGVLRCKDAAAGANVAAAFTTAQGVVVSGWKDLALHIAGLTQHLEPGVRDAIIDAVIVKIHTSTPTMTPNARSMITLRLSRTVAASVAAIRCHVPPPSPRTARAVVLTASMRPASGPAAPSPQAVPRRRAVDDLPLPALLNSESASDGMRASDVARIAALVAQEAALTAMMLDVVRSNGMASVVTALSAARDSIRAAEGAAWLRVLARGAPEAARHAEDDAADDVIDAAPAVVNGATMRTAVDAIPEPQSSPIAGATPQPSPPVAVVPTPTAAAVGVIQCSPLAPLSRRTGVRRADVSGDDAVGLPVRACVRRGYSSYA